MPLDRARIREFLDQDEGDPPPVFVGRDAILADILDTATRKAGRPKVTRAVQGAPGAGKTSLLHEMQQRWTGTGGNPRVVTVSSESVSHDTSGVIQAIMAAGTTSQDGWRRILRERLQRLKSVGASVAGYGLTAEFAVYGDAKLLSGAIRQGQEKTWKTPVIVAVDEAQALEGDPHSVAACFLREIHNAVTRLPLILVVAGLSDTAGKARDMNLTRNINIWETEPLEAAQARDFMRRLALYFGLDISRHNARLNDLTDLCDGWPRHLRHAGVALAEEALRVNGDMDRMGWTDVGREAWRLRQAYYKGQNSPEMQEADILTARVMAGLENGMHVRKVVELIEESVVDRPGQRLPDGETAVGFINHLIHQGALYRNRSGTIHSPIPSFRSYLIEAGTEPHAEADVRKDATDDDSTDFSP